MPKFAVISGFLGSGKTTVMMALTKHDPAVAMISNDLGEGVELADHRFAKLSGCSADQITDACICFCHDRLIETVEARFAEGKTLVVSDIPGFGVGALEHVYHGLAGKLDFAPFTVLVEPATIQALRAGEDLAHIQDAQLREADLIVLNKCDLLTLEEAAEACAYLAECYPEAEVLPISARRGDGIDALCRALLEGEASMRHPEIDYDGDALQNEMGSLSEAYYQYYAIVCCFDFDGTAYLRELAEEIACSPVRIPHLKLLAWSPDGDFGKVDWMSGQPLEITRPFARRCTELAVVINATAACDAKLLDAIISSAEQTVSDRFQLEVTVHKRESFGMGE